MSTWASAAGRWFACVGVAGGLASLCARVLITSSWGPVWLAVPGFAVEAGAIAAAALLVWATCRTQAEPAGPGQSILARSDDPSTSTEIVVRVDGQGTQSVRATLIACRALAARGSAPLVLVDLRGGALGRRPMRSLAREYGARYVCTSTGDQNGLAFAAELSDADALLLLDAGDIPSPDILHHLVPLLEQPCVAAVQAVSTAAPGDSPEQLPSGRRERDFERTVLSPRLGSRGVGVLTGSGALLRRGLLAEVAPVTASPAMAEAEVTAALFASHWKIVSSGGIPLVAVRAAASRVEWEQDNASRASAARHLVFGLHGALRLNRLSLRQRLSLLAWSVRPLAGVRRGWFLVVLAACLLAGQVPFTPTAWQLGVTLSSLTLVAVGLGLSSGWVLRPGDRARFSMRTLGSSWRGVLSPNGRVADPRRSLGTSFGVEHEVACAATVALLGLALGMRGLSDHVTHTLRSMPRPAEAGLVIVALWIVAVSLESQRLLVRRRTRRLPRVAGPLRGRIDTAATGRVPVAIGDVTVFGASFLNGTELSHGTTVSIELELADAVGDLRPFVLPASVVRAVRGSEGRVHHGVEFTALDRRAADALVRHCIVRPALDVLSLPAPALPAIVGQAYLPTEAQTETQTDAPTDAPMAQSTSPDFAIR